MECEQLAQCEDIIKALREELIKVNGQAMKAVMGLQTENKGLKQQARCPCGGELEGLGYGRSSATVCFQCKQCAAQLLLSMDTWNKRLNRP